MLWVFLKHTSVYIQSIFVNRCIRNVLGFEGFRAMFCKVPNDKRLNPLS